MGCAAFLAKVFFTSSAGKEGPHLPYMKMEIQTNKNKYVQKMWQMLVYSTIGCSGKKIPHFLGGKGGLSQIQAKIQLRIQTKMQIQIKQAQVQKFFFCRKWGLSPPADPLTLATSYLSKYLLIGLKSYSRYGHEDVNKIFEWNSFCFVLTI